MAARPGPTANPPARPTHPETVVGAPPVTQVVTSRVVTLPNALSGLRLLGVPLFVYLVLVVHADLLALGVLVFSGISDWLDGRLARAWGQVSRVGQFLDPLADRLYVFATVVTFAVRDLIPWWLVAGLAVRDLLLAGALGLLRRHGYGPLSVHFLGKAATFNLLYAFPLLLLSAQPGTVGEVAAVGGWAFAIWGVGLYWWSAVLYLHQAGGLIRAVRGRPPGGTA